MIKLYDFDTRQIIVFERQGKCNRCGACCFITIKHETSKDRPTYGIWRWLESRQFWYRHKSITLDGVRCGDLAEGYTCMNHDALILCRDFPIVPAEILEGCSYTFIEQSIRGMD